jgi:hypothetical protein
MYFNFYYSNFLNFATTIITATRIAITNFIINLLEKFPIIISAKSATTIKIIKTLIYYFNFIPKIVLSFIEYSFTSLTH